MKFIGFVETYSPTTQKNTNKHNYYMNGIIKDIISESCCADVCDYSKMRNLYAIADGSKNKYEGPEVAYLCMDIMGNVGDADFTKAYRSYFSAANRIVQGRSFSNNGATMYMDMGIIYIYQNLVNAFNFGNVSIFHKSEEGFTEISGEVPENIRVDKVVKKDGRFVVKKLVKKNTPHIGFISENLAVVPYKSGQIRLKNNDSLIIATEGIVSVLGKEAISDILNDENISQYDKAASIVEKAAKTNPEGNYTVLYITEKERKPVSKRRLKVFALLMAVLLAGVVTFAVRQGNFANIFNNGNNIEDVNVENAVPEDKEKPEENIVEDNDVAEEEIPAESTEQNQQPQTTSQPAQTSTKVPQNMAGSGTQHFGVIGEQMTETPQEPIQEDVETVQPDTQSPQQSAENVGNTDVAEIPPVTETPIVPEEENQEEEKPSIQDIINSW